MSMERVFGREGSLVGANGRNAGQVAVGTVFTLTGNYCIEDGWKDFQGNIRNPEKKYAYFEGTRNGDAVKDGIAASILLRQPKLGGFTKEQLAELTEFGRKLAGCGDAGDLDKVLAEAGVYGGKSIVCTKWIYNTEIPYGQKTERPIPYSVFDVK